MTEHEIISVENKNGQLTINLKLIGDTDTTTAVMIYDMKTEEVLERSHDYKDYDRWDEPEKEEQDEWFDVYLNTFYFLVIRNALEIYKKQK